MAIKKEEPKDISVSLSMKTITVPIVGTNPLIVNRFSEKAAQQIKEIGELSQGVKQGGKKKNIVAPEEQYENSLEYMADGKTYGFPARSFKAAIVTAGYRIFKVPQTILRSAILVLSDDSTGNVKIEGEPRMREDMVRVGTINKVASPRYRAEFPEWSTTLRIRFFANVITEEDLVSIIQAAGYACGVGEWRPEKSNSGWAGTFEIAG